MIIDEKIQQQLLAVISLLGIHDVHSIEKIWESDVFSFKLSDGRKNVVKRIGQVSEDLVQRYKFCHDVVNHLHENKIPVFLPIKDKEGSDIIIHNGQLFVIMPYVQNDTDASLKDTVTFKKTLHNIGKSFALMHQALANYPSDKIDEKVWRSPLSEEMINYRSSQMLPYLDGNERIRIEHVLDNIVPQMNEAFSGLSEQLIHRDCHLGNILLHDSEVVAFIDNDHFSIGPRILDLGYFLNSLLKFHPAGFLEPEKWIEHISPFIKGYTSLISLNQVEINALHYATISIPMQFVGWCFETGRTELGRSMISAMELMYSQIDELRTCMQESIHTE